MNGAEGVLIINIGVASLFALGYAILAFANPSQRAALGIASTYLLGMGSPLSDLAGTRLGMPVAAEWSSYLCFLISVSAVSIAYAAFHGRPGPWRAVVAVVILGVAVRAILPMEPQNTLVYGLAYQIPFALSALVAGRTVLTIRTGVRPLAVALGAVFALIAATDLIKPLLAIAFGAGRTLETYTGTAYALLSQVISGLLLVAAGLLMLLIVAQKAITESQVESETDPLSGLLNRRGFDRRATDLLAGAQAARQPLAAAMFDLDHFKHINDDHGHEVGDAVIAATAALLAAGAPPGALVGRMGGEEFILLMRGVPEAEAHVLIEWLRARISRLSPDLPPVTASCGIAQLRSGETLADLMRRADLAAYQAKRTGRDRLCASG